MSVMGEIGVILTIREGVLASEPPVSSVRGHCHQSRDHRYDPIQGGAAEAGNAESETPAGEQERESPDVRHERESQAAFVLSH